MSILSKQTDGMGFYYGWLEGDTRQINIRRAARSVDQDRDIWHGYVGGELVASELTAKAAEAAAIAWARAHPER